MGGHRRKGTKHAMKRSKESMMRERARSTLRVKAKQIRTQQLRAQGLSTHGGAPDREGSVGDKKKRKALMSHPESFWIARAKAATTWKAMKAVRARKKVKGSSIHQCKKETAGIGKVRSSEVATCVGATFVNSGGRRLIGKRSEFGVGSSEQPVIRHTSDVRHIPKTPPPGNASAMPIAQGTPHLPAHFLVPAKASATARHSSLTVEKQSRSPIRQSREVEMSRIQFRSPPPSRRSSSSKSPVERQSRAPTVQKQSQGFMVSADMLGKAPTKKEIVSRLKVIPANWTGRIWPNGF